MRLIDAEVLLKHLKTFLEDHKTVLTKTTIKAVIAIVEMMPTIEAKPVVPAHWKRKNNETKCSNCEFIYYSNHDDFNYCPNCGARMDEKI